MWQATIFGFLGGVMGGNAFPRFARGITKMPCPNRLGNVFTRLRSVHSACRTSVRVLPAIRRQTEQHAWLAASAPV